MDVCFPSLKPSVILRILKFVPSLEELSEFKGGELMLHFIEGIQEFLGRMEESAKGHQGVRMLTGEARSGHRDVGGWEARCRETGGAAVWAWGPRACEALRARGDRGHGRTVSALCARAVKREWMKRYRLLLMETRHLCENRILVRIRIQF